MDDTSSDAAVKRGRSKGALCGVFFIFKPYPLFKQDSGCGRETFLPGGLPAPSPVWLWCQPTCASGSDDPTPNVTGMCSTGLACSFPYPVA